MSPDTYFEESSEQMCSPYIRRQWHHTVGIYQVLELLYDTERNVLILK